MSWWHYVAAVQWNFNRYAMDLVVVNQTCPLVHWKSKRKGTWPMPLHHTCQLIIRNFISQDCYIVHTTYMPWVAMSLQQQNIMHACLVLLSPISLLFEHAYWLRAAARWVLAGLWPLNQQACWPFVTQYCMSAGGVLLFLLYLLVWCFIIGHAFWLGTYQPCMLVLCLTIGHDFWGGASP